MHSPQIVRFPIVLTLFIWPRSIVLCENTLDRGAHGGARCNICVSTDSGNTPSLLTLSADSVGGRVFGYMQGVLVANGAESSGVWQIFIDVSEYANMTLNFETLSPWAIYAVWQGGGTQLLQLHTIIQHHVPTNSSEMITQSKGDSTHTCDMFMSNLWRF